MGTVKGPQIYLNKQDPAEAEIIKWAEGLGRGRKSLATIDAIIAGRAIARVCQPLADLLLSASRRGEDLTLEQLDDYIKMFRAHGSRVPVAPTALETSEAEPPAENDDKTPEKATDEQEEQLELTESHKSGFDSLGG